MKKKNIKLIILKIGMLLCLGVGLYPVITQAYTYYQTQQTLNSYKENMMKLLKRRMKKSSRDIQKLIGNEKTQNKPQSRFLKIITIFRQMEIFRRIN